jgi:hypothetical protein
VDRFASARRDDQALLNSLVKASLAEVRTAPSIPRSFVPKPQRIREDELESGSARPPVRPVRANFVSCNRPSDATRAITGPDPVGTIQAANTRAIALLDHVIDELQFTRNRIVAASGWPTISDVAGA